MQATPAPYKQTHFRKLAKVIRDNEIKDTGITNVDEKGFVMGVSHVRAA